MPPTPPLRLLPLLRPLRPLRPLTPPSLRLRTRAFGTPPTPHEHNPYQNPSNDLGGPGGQELYPASSPLRRRYATTTAVGVVAACVAMAMAKLMQVTTRPDTVYVLVHDDTKGELDDVRRVPVRVRGD